MNHPFTSAGSVRASLACAGAALALGLGLVLVACNHSSANNPGADAGMQSQTTPRASEAWDAGRATNEAAWDAGRAMNEAAWDGGRASNEAWDAGRAAREDAGAHGAAAMTRTTHTLRTTGELHASRGLHDGG